MRTIDLIAGENLKTHIPIKYVPPIVSESLVVSAAQDSANVAYQTEYEPNGCQVFEYLNRTERVKDFFETPKMYIDTGYTHLANKGLFNDQVDCCKQFVKTIKNYDIDRHSIYDPRFYSFGDESRCVLNKKLGKIDYDYDDINFIKFPQIIHRNILDITPPVYNELSVDFYTNMQLMQREDLQNEWLKRRASDRLQKKMFPLHTMGPKIL